MQYGWISSAARQLNGLTYFISRFEGTLQFDNQETDMLYEDFVDYKTLSINEPPEDDLTDAVIQENKNSNEYRIDIIRYYIYQMKSPVASNYRFGILFNVARLVLVTPYSNPGIERLYALVNKNKR